MGMVQQHFYWLGISRDVKDVVASCQRCEADRFQWQKSMELRPVPVEGPWHRVVIDLVGPLPRTTRGHIYIVSAIDHFTKWAEVAPLQSRHSAQIAEFILRDLIARHGKFHVLHSDNATEFKGSVDELLNQFGIRHSLSAPGHPQSAGLVERFQKTLVSAIERCASHQPLNWDLYLPIALLGYRSSIQSSTKYTPFFLEYGREANLMFQEEPAFQESTLGDAETAEPIASHVAFRTMQIESTLPSVLANVTRAQAGQKRHFDERYAKGIAKSQETAKLKAGDWVRLKPDEHHMRNCPEGR